MRRFLASTVLLLTTAAAAVLVTAQVPEKPPSFDVAAIKENKSGENDGRMGGPPSRFTATNVPVLQLIVFAYDNTPTFRIENARTGSGRNATTSTRGPKETFQWLVPVVLTRALR